MESGERALQEREREAYETHTPNFTDSFRNLQTIKAHPHILGSQMKNI